MANEYIIFNGSSFNITFKDNSEYTLLNCGSFFVGHHPSYGYLHGAIRIPSIPINRGQFIHSAGLVLTNINRLGDSIYARSKGIAENNTSDFSSDPFGRSRTSSSSDHYWNDPPNGSRLDIGVTGPLQEIVNRSGWNYNNAAGFVIEAKNESSHGSQPNYIGCSSAYLWFRLAAEPNFKPTPITVAAPTFPGSRGYGLKISAPGVDVKTATDSQLLYTSDKEYMKILAEGQISTTANTQYLIAHGLTYTPRVLAFGRANGKSFELPRLFGGALDPVGSGLQGYVSVDSSNIRIFTFTNSDVYFYVFLDELT